MSQGFTAHLCVDFSFLSCLSLLPAGCTLGPGSSPVQAELDTDAVLRLTTSIGQSFFPDKFGISLAQPGCAAPGGRETSLY